MGIEFLENVLNGAKDLFIDREKVINNYTLSIDDEIVKNASFYPLRNGGTNTITHYLEQDEKGNIIFKPKVLIFWTIKIIFLSPIFIILFFIITNNLSGNMTYIEGIENYREFIALFIILNVFLWMIISLFSKTKVFDFENNCFYDLRFKKFVGDKEKDLSKIGIIDFLKIYAIQIIPERVLNNKTSNINNNNNRNNQIYFNNYYTSYELNLILKDSSRVLVVDHGNLSEIRNNAQLLAQKLNIKIYDLTTVING